MKEKSIKSKYFKAEDHKKYGYGFCPICNKLVYVSSICGKRKFYSCMVMHNDKKDD